MYDFISHEIINKGGEEEVILYLNPHVGMEEFSDELGTDPKKELYQSAMGYIKKYLPRVRFKHIKVMVAGVLVATFLGTTLVVPNQYLPTASAATGLAVDQVTVGNFTAVVLNGKTQSTYANINSFNVSDTSGLGIGWNVVIKATQLKTVDGNTLPLGSLTVSAPTVAKATTTSSDVSTIAVSSGAIDTTSGIKLLSASINGGMGSYTVSFPADALKLNLLPKDVKRGTYSSTISLTINSGP